MHNEKDGCCFSKNSKISLIIRPSIHRLFGDICFRETCFPGHFLDKRIKARGTNENVGPESIFFVSLSSLNRAIFETITQENPCLK